jgi:sulfonate transport system substrate-binding protein
MPLVSTSTASTEAIEFCDPAVYRELFNLCITRASLDDPKMRPKIVAFVRALIAATQQLKRTPQEAQRLVARAA